MPWRSAAKVQSARKVQAGGSSGQGGWAAATNVTVNTIKTGSMADARKSGSLNRAVSGVVVGEKKFELFGWSCLGFEAFDEGSTFCIDGTAVQGWIVEVGWILLAAVVDVESLQVGCRIDLSSYGRIFVKI